MQFDSESWWKHKAHSCATPVLRQQKSVLLYTAKKPNTCACAPTGDGQYQSNVTPGFVETFEVGVCRGPYTSELVRAWHKWDKAHGSENDPVDGLQVGWREKCCVVECSLTYDLVVRAGASVAQVG